MTSASSEGSDVSTTSTSLENLESIRPSGVTSKNCKGAFNTLSNKSSCRIRAARQQAKYGIKSAKNDAIAANNDHISPPHRPPALDACGLYTRFYNEYIFYDVLRTVVEHGLSDTADEATTLLTTGGKRCAREL